VAKKTQPAAPPNRRGSPEAIAKRRAARAFNDLLDPGKSELDGRTDKRRRRLLAELESGKARGSGKALKPIDVLSHVTELLALGETLPNIRKVCKIRAAPGPDARLMEILPRLHRAYGFPVEAYAFVGIGDELLRKAGISGKARRGTAAREPEAPPKRRREA
jgi:hypothetical protein